MKKLIYGSLIFLCFLIGLIVLLLYYTQDFTEELTFVNSLDFAKDFTSDYSIESINWIEAKIGTLSLENNGYFSETYTLPTIVGCLDLSLTSSLKLPQEKFEVSFDSMRRGQEIKVLVGKEVNYDLVARYSPPRASISFNSLRENVVSVSLYSLKQKEENPFGRVYYDNTFYMTCEEIAQKYEPIKKIVLFDSS